jgi:hypothetical protein
MFPDAWIVVPTRNEAANVGPFVRALLARALLEAIRRVAALRLQSRAPRADPSG